MKEERTFQVLVFLGLCLAFSYVYSQVGEQYGCEKDICKKQPRECNEFDHEDKCKGRLIKNATVPCGCCHLCVHQLKKGESCNIREDSKLPRKECGSSLTCLSHKEGFTNGTCGDANTRCIEARNKFDEENSELGGYTMGAPRPDCNEFGEYKPVVCKKGMKCYCVDTNGNRIFGLAPYTEEEKMTCACSRDFESYKPQVKKPSDAHLFLRCNPNGDYAPTQCIDDKKCYCVDKFGNVTKRPSSQIDLKNLICDGQTFYKDTFDTPCITEYKEKMAQIQSLTGKIVIGIEPPSCDLDGSYSPVQCQGFECYCVNKRGEKIARTAVLRNSEKTKHMTCNCVREKAMLEDVKKNKDTQTFDIYQCQDNGNYLPMQCTDAHCFCVDVIHGFQIGASTVINNRRELSCYNAEFDDIFNVLWD